MRLGLSHRALKAVRRPTPALWALADQVAVSGGGFVTNVLAARLLGLEGFGTFALSWLVVLFFQSIQTALITSPLMVIGSSDESELPNNYSNAMWWMQVIFASAISISVYICTSILNQADYQNLIFPLIFLLIFSQLQDFSRRFYFTRHKPHIPFFQDATRYTIQVAVLLLLQFGFFSLEYDTPMIIWVCAASALVSVAPFTVKMSSKFCTSNDILSAFKRNLGFSKWQLGSALLQWLTSNFVLIASAATLGTAAAGALRAGQTLLGTTHIFFQAAENIVPQRAATIRREGGIEKLQGFIRKLAIVAISVTSLACLIFAVPGEFWITLIFGKEYSGFGFVISGYAAIYFVMGLVMPLRFSLMALENSRAIFASYLIGALVTLASAHFLIDAFGIFGALATLLASQVALAGTLLVGNRIATSARGTVL